MGNIDYGRGVASSQDPRCKAVAKALDSFHLETLREILEVSSHSVVAGVRIPDCWRERTRQLLVARQILTSPRGGLMERIANQANRASPKLGIFRIVDDFLVETKGPPLEDFRSKGEIKKWIGLAGVESESGRKLPPSPHLPLLQGSPLKATLKGPSRADRYLRASRHGSVLRTLKTIQNSAFGSQILWC